VSLKRKEMVELKYGLRRLEREKRNESNDEILKLN